VAWRKFWCFGVPRAPTDKICYQAWHGVAGPKPPTSREHTARPVLPKAPLVPAKALKPRLVLIF